MLCAISAGEPLPPVAIFAPLSIITAPEFAIVDDSPPSLLKSPSDFAVAPPPPPIDWARNPAEFLPSVVMDASFDAFTEPPLLSPSTEPPSMTLSPDDIPLNPPPPPTDCTSKPIELLPWVSMTL